MAHLVAPVFLAMILTIAAHPLRSRLMRHGMPGWLAGLVVMLVVYLTLAALLVSLLFSAGQFVRLIPTYKAQWDAALDTAAAWLRDMGIDAGAPADTRGGLELDRLVNAVGGLLGGLGGVTSALALVVTFVFFMTLDAGWFSERLLRLSGRRSLAEALGLFASGTRRYLVVSTVFGLVVALFDTVALLWIGVPGAALWGLLAFVTNYVPNIGFVIGILPPTLLALLEGGPAMALTVVIFYIAINFVIQSMLQPRIVGSVVGLSGTMTMLSLVFWAYTLGALGALMAVPLTLLAKALLVDADPHMAWLGTLLTPHEPSYRGRTTERRPNGSNDGSVRRGQHRSARP
jgi:AI-2 transport protein TqsA